MGLEVNLPTKVIADLDEIRDKNQNKGKNSGGGGKNLKTPKIGGCRLGGLKLPTMLSYALSGRKTSFTPKIQKVMFNGAKSNSGPIKIRYITMKIPKITGCRYMGAIVGRS